MDSKCRRYHHAKRACSNAVALPYPAAAMKAYPHEARSCAHEGGRNEFHVLACVQWQCNAQPAAGQQNAYNKASTIKLP